MHSGDPQKGTAPIAAFASASTVVVISPELHALQRSINSSARSVLLFHDTLEADGINVSAISHPLQPLYMYTPANAWANAWANAYGLACAF